jgi:nicotinamide mononucleotide transporter
MVIKKELYNWLYWIVIDIVSVYMYFSRELQLTAFLYVFYATLAIIGYFTWLKNVKNNA